jgi:hypothetical protein
MSWSIVYDGPRFGCAMRLNNGPSLALVGHFRLRHLDDGMADESHAGKAYEAVLGKPYGEAHRIWLGIRNTVMENPGCDPSTPGPMLYCDRY